MIMEIQESSIEKLLNELNSENKGTVLTEEEFNQAEKEINEEMRNFSLEQRSYFNRSVQSASKAYLTF
jgi:hypothetical protein